MTGVQIDPRPQRETARFQGRRRPHLRPVLGLALVAVLASTGCAAEVMRVAKTTPPPSTVSSSTVPAPAQADLPAVTVTVPQLETPTTSETTPSVVETEEPPAAPPAALEVDLDGCASCKKVLATAPEVFGDLGAAVVRLTKKRTGLIAVAADGTARKPQVIGHGLTARAGAPLGCDIAGRCVVVGEQTDGKAIAVAYALDAEGAWTDLSGPNAFPSATDRAGIIDVNGSLGIAVQESGAGQTGWIVLTWSGARYTVAGCAADSAALPAAADLSTAACLS